ncbi:MAG: DUF934 domain-containing protein [Pseudorhodobacter sp.]
MNVIVTDKGFSTESATPSYVKLDQITLHDGVVDLENTDDPAVLISYLADLRLIRVAFPAFTDGRGFTLARRLRMMGYKGRLRAHGHLLADQYAMARRVGFDEVEIDKDLAARQPEDQWLFRADWQARSYQSRMRA